MKHFPSKNPNETLVLTFGFTKIMRSSETLTGTPTAVVSLSSGTTDPAMGSMVQDVQLDVANNNVLVKLAGGVQGNTYVIEARTATTLGQTPALAGALPVSQ